MITIIKKIYKIHKYKKEINAVNYVIKHANKNDPLDAMKKFEDYCIKNPMMNVGPIKGLYFI